MKPYSCGLWIAECACSTNVEPGCTQSQSCVACWGIVCRIDKNKRLRKGNQWLGHVLVVLWHRLSYSRFLHRFVCLWSIILVCLSELLVFHHYTFFAYVVTNWMKLCTRWSGWTRLWKNFGHTLTRSVLTNFFLAQNIHMPWPTVKWVYVLNSPCIRQLESLSRGKYNQFWINMHWVWFSELSWKLWLLAPKLHI